MIVIKFKVKNNKKYKFEVIIYNVIYTKELKLDYLLKLYYLIFYKDYLKKKST